jgi:polysaccharide export outer membrane protein
MRERKEDSMGSRLLKVICRVLAMMLAFTWHASNAQGSPPAKPDKVKESSSKPGKAAAKEQSPTAAPAQDVAAAKAQAPANLDEEYTIGEQDVLGIAVWKENDLSKDVVVRPDGKITVPLVGEIDVVGMKPRELQDLLTEKLKPFVSVPEVSIVVRAINSRHVYVIGNINRQGKIPINSRTTLLQLIAEAGGLGPYANRKKIYVLRDEKGKQLKIFFNYDEVIQGKKPEQNIVLRPGDTVVVP